MKIVITEKDLANIWGKYIFQIEEGKDKLLHELIAESSNKEFYFIKRIHKYYPIDNSKILVCGLLGDSWILNKTPIEFVEFFNNYIKTSEVKREHRLLASNELDLVFEFLKKRYFINNYDTTNSKWS